MCCYALNIVFRDGEIPFNVVCLSGHLHDPESVYQDPTWLDNSVALSFDEVVILVIAR